jgi:hypothetical protein
MGVLAIALGIGAVIANSPGMALADTTGTSSPTSSAVGSSSSTGPESTASSATGEATSNSLVNHGIKVTYSQTFGGVLNGNLDAPGPDGNKLTYAIASQPVHGSVVVHSDGSFTYTPDALSAYTGGTDRFTVSVTHPVGNPSSPGSGHTATFAVTVTNTACVLCTADQKTIDDLAMRIAATPQMQAAKVTAETAWKAAIEAQIHRPFTATDQAALDAAMAQMLQWYGGLAADSDPYRPIVRWANAPEHTWGDGDTITGSKFAGDSANFIYRSIPIDPSSKYQLSGRVDAAGQPLEDIFQLTTDYDQSVIRRQFFKANLNIQADGTFSLTLGPVGSGADVVIPAGTKQLFIRDTLVDWNTQLPPEYNIKRFDGPAAPPAQTFDQQVALAAHLVLGQIQDSIVQTYVPLQFGSCPSTLQPFFCTNNPPQVKVNTPGMIFPGAAVSRNYMHYVIGDNQALVVTTTAGTASDTSVTLQDIATVSADYLHHQSSLNTATAVANPDGSYTWVISGTDPGVQNWVDTTGIDDGTLYLRWLGYANPMDPFTTQPPTITAQVVNLDDLNSVLPARTATVTKKQRQQDLAERAAGYANRFHSISPT